MVDAGGFLSTVFDFGSQYRDENALVQHYRSMSLYPEVDMAIEDIINDSIVFNDNKKAIEVNLDQIALSDNIKLKIISEFRNVLKLLDFSNKGFEIFRRWYIDGKVYYHCVIDITRPDKGIVELRPIDPLKIRKVKKIERENKLVGNVQTPAVKSIEEYYLYTDIDPDSIMPTGNGGMKIAPRFDCLFYFWTHRSLIKKSDKLSSQGNSSSKHASSNRRCGRNLPHVKSTRKKSFLCRCWFSAKAKGRTIHERTHESVS